MAKTTMTDEEIKEILARDPRSLENIQIAIYVATGGGTIGSMYAHQPLVAYRDTRAGRSSYKDQDIERLRRWLILAAEVRGLDPRSLPEMPRLFHCEVWD